MLLATHVRRDEVTKRDVTIPSRWPRSGGMTETFAVQDPYGYQICFGQTVGDVVPTPGTKMI